MPVTEPTRPYIPYNVTVHLGPPDSNAENVTVEFPRYIANVASSEIYPTWEESAIYANIYAQISFTLNRIYTEYYRSRGYDFDITNSTAIDQSFNYGGTVFQNIERIVGEIFSTYISRIGNLEPLAARYCNGTTTTCDGLSQWGSQSLAQQGYETMQILYTYYGYNIQLNPNTPLVDPGESYPGTALRPGSTGRNVSIVQIELNRIAQNYPAIPKIPTISGVFDEATEAAVIRFQQIFNLVPDGIVGRATWYRLVYLYVGITRLSELDSEGVRVLNTPLEYTGFISEGDTGQRVRTLQYFLSLSSDFYSTVERVGIDGVFGPDTRRSVASFQRAFDLPETGIVDFETWNMLYDVFAGIYAEIFSNSEIFPVDTLAAPAEPLMYGSSGSEVRELQEYLNTISLTYTEISPIMPNGFFGDQTRDAVTSYQRLFDLPETGTVDEAVWNSISNTYKDTLSPVLTRPGQYQGSELSSGDADNVNGGNA